MDTGSNIKVNNSLTKDKSGLYFLKSPEGIKLLDYLKDRYHFYTEIKAEDCRFYEGQRSVVLHLEKELKQLKEKKDVRNIK